MDVNMLLKPRKIAVVGASEKDNLGGSTVKMLMRGGPERMKDVYLINPGRETIFSYPCYKSLSDIDGSIDLVVIATAKHTVNDLLREAASKGAKAAVVFASGYGETGKPEDKEDEIALLALCAELDIAMMGPNCAGYMNFVDKLYPMGFIATGRENAGKIGLVSQSGMVCTLLLDSHKCDFTYVISCGNSKAVQVVDFLEFLVDDEDTKVVAAYMEGVTDSAKFVRVLKKAAAKKKPVVLLKAGRSEAGSRAAASHTGSMSGSDKAFDAIAKKFGLIRVDDLEDLCSVSNMLAVLPELPQSNNIAAVNGSGGETAVTGDVGASYGLNFPEFSEDTKEKLAALLPGYSTVNNPLDITATPAYDTDIFCNLLEIVADDPNIDMIMVGNTIVGEMTDLCVKHMSEGMALYKSKNKATKPIISVPLVEADRLSSVVSLLRDAGIPVTSTTSYAHRQLKLVLDYAEWKKSAEWRSIEFKAPSEHEGDTRSLSERDSKALLAKYGVPVPKDALVTSRDEAMRTAEQIGFPLVMKIESADILHKSDAGGVKLNIKSAEQAGEFYNEILSNAKAYMPEARINGVLMQEMLPYGTEVIIGVNNDPVFGPMILFGLGGVFVELFKDVSLYPAPVNKREAMEMINSLESSKLFYGYRGAATLDTEAIADIIVKVSDFAVANIDTLAEADINPLFVYEKGVAVADGLVVLRK